MRIAVGTDFSESAKLAYPVALDLTRRLHAELYVLHQAGASDDRPALWPGPENAAARLGRLIESDPDLRQAQPAPLLLAAGDPESLGEFLEQKEIDLLVVGARGRDHAGGRVVGRFAERAAKHAPCSVLVVRGGRRSDATGRPRFERILVACELTRRAASGIELASRWARLLDAHVRLVHVVPRLERTRDGEKDAGAITSRRVEEAVCCAEQELRSIAMDERIHAEITVGVGEPVESILRQAEEFDADLLVLSTRPSTVPDPRHSGSVTERALFESTCPVLVAKPQRAGDTGTRPLEQLQEAP